MEILRDRLRRPWFDGRTGHDGYCLAELTFATDLGDHPLPLDEYQEVLGPREDWMKGDRFFVAHGLLERIRQGGGYCSSQISITGPVLKICHNLEPCVQGLSETRMLMELASDLQLVHWRFEVGCRTVDTWAQGRDAASLAQYLKEL